MSSSIVVSAYAYEVSGITQSTSVASVVDIAQNGTVTGAATLATGTGTTTGVDDIAFGVAMASSSSLTMTLSGAQPAAWTQQPEQQNTGNPSTAVAGFTVVPNSGTSVKYSTAWSGSLNAVTSVVAFTSGTETSLPSSIPYTVVLDSLTWDVNQTVAGVGFSYDPNQVMYVNQGQRLAVLWTNLPTALYTAYDNALACTAWFRYDPAIPANAAILGG